MSDEEAPKKDDGDAGSPAWVMTFADLMSLLMCFFVLLLSFSEMDVQKYKQLSGSMRAAFGVQRQVAAHEIPKGTSIVAKEFRPGKPLTTVKKEVRQSSTDTERKRLGTNNGHGSSKQKKSNKQKKGTENDAKKLAEKLGQEIKDGKVEIEVQDKKIIVRVLEKGAFPSGMGEMHRSFHPSIEKIKNVLTKVHGQVKVIGHTDDIPMHSDRYNSNWELSAGRAGSVVHHLTKDGQLDASRFEIIGLADTKPRVPNTNPANRAKNRRVEIIIQQGSDEELKKEELKVLQATLPGNKPKTVEAPAPQPEKKAQKTPENPAPNAPP